MTKGKHIGAYLILMTEYVIAQKTRDGDPKKFSKDHHPKTSLITIPKDIINLVIDIMTKIMHQ